MENKEKKTPNKDIQNLCKAVYEEGQEVLKKMQKCGISDIRITCVDKALEEVYEKQRRERGV